MIRSGLLWKELNEEEKKFYKQKYNEYVKAQEKAGVNYDNIANELNEYILFCIDGDEIYLSYDTTNY